MLLTIRPGKINAVAFKKGAAITLIYWYSTDASGMHLETNGIDHTWLKIRNC